MEQKVLYLRQTLSALKAFIALIVIVVFSANILHSQCPDFISVSTQAEIDNFLINYPNCTEIEYNMDINNGVDITNLDGFSNIVSVGGYLGIENCPLIEDVDGISNLTYIGQFIRISNCGIINNLSGLENVLHYNGLWILDCDSLTSLQGLENISSTATFFTIELCESLTDLTTFPNLNKVIGHFDIRALHSLTNLYGLENLDSIGGNVGLSQNPKLSNVEALGNLSKVGGIFTLSHNYELENLHGLEGLKSIGLGLRIYNNTSLNTLSGLDSLTSIEGDLWIYENNSLQSLTGIDNIEAESIMNLNITYNPQLSTCAVQSVCDYLANPNGDIQIYVNAQGCNNSVEVVEACTVGITEQQSDSHLSVYPNPFTTSTTIEYELKGISDIQFTVYNIQGVEVYEWEQQQAQPGIHKVTWSPTFLPTGMYYAVLRSEEGVSIVKMVKQ